MMFETAETRYGNAINRLHDTGQLPVIPPAHLWVCTIVGYAEAGRVKVPDPVGIADTPTVNVHLHTGVWRVQCPFCPGGQHASQDGYFYCFYCRNEKAGGRVIRQTWPVNVDEIERTLSFRPDPKYRHWFPGETIADLRRQDLKAIRAGLHLQGGR